MKYYSKVDGDTVIWGHEYNGTFSESGHLKVDLKANKIYIIVNDDAYSGEIDFSEHGLNLDEMVKVWLKNQAKRMAISLKELVKLG